MKEPVRLIIWDLDETFWRGTLTEGGIREHVAEHELLVLELARRGIISSICSKNDETQVREILQNRGILQYFVFPSISWEPKGYRIKRLIEDVQLRAPTIMFIDDNPNNRAEAEAIVPGLQVEAETIIPSILNDPRFKGKSDPELSRLTQYKLLEKRKRDAEHSAGGNGEFLRGCDVRVYIDYDIPSNLDRAIELINRTNQLNFTKKRLPEDLEAARRALLTQIEPFDAQAGLVRVVDKYGDYGYVGFFLTNVHRRTIVEGRANTRLVHFCFSCRTLGMLVEQWVYDHLGRPELDIIGEVLTDLTVPRRIDWVRRVETLGDQTSQHLEVSPRTVVYGGCEAHIVGGYLNAYSKQVEVYGNYASNGLFTRINNTTTILDICDRDRDQYAHEAATLGLPLQLESGDLFSSGNPDTLFVFNLSFDASPPPRLSHKRYGWTSVLEPRQLPGANFLELSEDQLLKHLDETTASYSDEQRQHIIRVSRHIRENYELLPSPSKDERLENIRNLIMRTPKGSKFIAALNHHEIRINFPSEVTKSSIALIQFTETLRDLEKEFPYFAVASVTEVIRSVHDLRGADHYTREVYVRFAERIVEIAQRLQSRMDEPLPKEQIAKKARDDWALRRRENEARAFVSACYESLLLRRPDPLAENYVRNLSTGVSSHADLLRAIVRSAEFGVKWKSQQLDKSA